MDQAVKARWVEALRSGRYRQTDGTLKDERGHCCLGVLCEVERPPEVEIGWNTIQVRVPSEDGEPDVHIDAVLGPDLERRWGTGDTAVLTRMNDTEGLSFAEIADWIEAHL